MNIYIGGLITICSTITGGSVVQENIILTEDGNDIFTEDSLPLLTET